MGYMMYLGSKSRARAVTAVCLFSIDVRSREMANHQGLIIAIISTRLYGKRCQLKLASLWRSSLS